ncbi:MAG: exosortase C-terminal domain/associated protein EpsI, partial [Alphaproteobacteria bacterium]
VFLDGIFISIPTGNFLVAEACAGVRFLIATIALGTLFADITYRSWWRRAAFMLLALSVPIIANGLRAFGIVMLAHLTDNKLAVGVDHIVYGWVFFAFVTFVLLAVGMTFREHDVHGPATSGEGTTTNTGRATRQAAAGLAALILAAVAPAYAWQGTAGPEIAAVAVPAPVVAAPWRMLEPYAGNWIPVFSGADGQLLKSYGDGQTKVHLHVAYFVRQRENAELVAYENQLLPEDGPWTRAESGRTIAQIDGQSVEVVYTRARGRRGARLLWNWYWVDSRFVGRDLEAKLLQARARILGGRPETAAITIATDFYDNPEEAARTLQSFLDSMTPLGSTLLGMGKQ